VPVRIRKVISSRAEFERRVLPLQDDLFHAALALTRREADALDLVQETLLKAYRRASSFDRGDNLKAWLFTILRNAYVDGCRSRRVEPVPLDPSLEDPPAPEPPPPTLETALPDDLLMSLRELSPAHQLLLLLCDVEGLAYKEIAEVMGCPMGSVMSGIHNARTRLRAHLLRARATESPRK
jgi:RNA polymerase sigma-70 factor, ECF subfamily